MAGGILILFVLCVSLACTLGLYLLLESETSNPTVVDRADAERDAKARGGTREHAASSSSARPAERREDDSDSRAKSEGSYWDER
ncbi:hypothetical protein [Natronolimnobius baerhuensis]|uniref:Uncharacterized protein n=1 Tax=Natronolimnobius baerhuensis TaxID=253108 RepID=A0A202E9X5_9EURY|nr:hypothetical protein [Natronolimnobius baerhuensis]OVE85055.1 hypothetical protein B2G88_11940 [Natronolimnobius baerhuensis]